MNSLTARAGTVVAAALSSIIAFAPGTAGAAASGPSTAAAVPRPSAPVTTVVARGLDAPKYVTFGPGGIYVAESGSGGPHCVVGVANVSVTHVCAGSTGSVVRVAGGRVQTLERGLASASVASTHGVSGVTAVGFTGGRMAVLFDDGGVGPTGVSGIASPTVHTSASST